MYTLVSFPDSRRSDCDRWCGPQGSADFWCGFVFRKNPRRFHRLKPLVLAAADPPAFLLVRHVIPANMNGCYLAAVDSTCQPSLTVGIRLCSVHPCLPYLPLVINPFLDLYSSKPTQHILPHSPTLVFFFTCHRPTSTVSSSSSDVVSSSSIAGSESPRGFDSSEG